MQKLNMGCGNNILSGYLNRDIVNLLMEDNEFDEIYCSHVLEHMNDLGKVMDELFRIGKDGCKIKVKTPYFASPNAWGDYTHKRTFNTNTFNYFSKNCYYNKIDLSLIKYKIHFFSNSIYLESEIKNIIPDFLINLFPKVYERFFAYRFPASEIHYLLEIKK